MGDGEGEGRHIREGWAEHGHEFEFDLDGNGRQLKDFSLKDGILAPISKR